MKLYSHTANGTLYQGDCLDVLKFVPFDSIDTIITDPPYGLSFMGKKWDYDVPSVAIWKECLRVLKPGATALIFAGSRTQHRMAVNVEDAGFILKDTIMWIYGSGFPKSTDVSKQIDKYRRRDYVLAAKKLGFLPPSNSSFKDWTTEEHAPGEKHWKEFKRLIPEDDWIKIEREVIGNKMSGIANKAEGRRHTIGASQSVSVDITVPATNEAKLWNGWGTALKPAYEPILVAMKPNDGTYAQNALKHGVAGLHIDGGRIETDEIKSENAQYSEKGFWNTTSGKALRHTGNGTSHTKGRFPANVIFDPEAARLLDEQSGILKSGARKGASSAESDRIFKLHGGKSEASQGGASRFFYCAKASKSERNTGCEGLEEKLCGGMSGTLKQSLLTGNGNTRNNQALNHHPTVKPLALMEYLCNLTKTPSGGTVLDPFAGSGTTGIACVNTSRSYTLIERNEDYCRIIAARLGQAWFDKLCSEKNVRSNP